MRQANNSALSLATAALVLGLAAQAFADVPPTRERTRRTIEPQHAPPMTPPLEQAPPPEAEAPQPETEPPSQQAPETTQPTPDAKAEAKTSTEGKSGSCSIDTDSDQTIAGIAALVLLIAGAGLLGRRG
jgi:hypothetical protein